MTSTVSSTQQVWPLQRVSHLEYQITFGYTAVDSSEHVWSYSLANVMLTCERKHANAMLYEQKGNIWYSFVLGIWSFLLSYISLYRRKTTLLHIVYFFHFSIYLNETWYLISFS